MTIRTSFQTRQYYHGAPLKGQKTALKTREISEMPTECSNSVTIRMLLKRAYLGPREVALITRQSISTTRKQMLLLQQELPADTIKLANCRISTHVIVKKYNLDIPFLTLNGAIDEPLTIQEESQDE